jgi:hypothetical protein
MFVPAFAQHNSTAIRAIVTVLAGFKVDIACAIAFGNRMGAAMAVLKWRV